MKWRVIDMTIDEAKNLKKVAENTDCIIQLIDKAVNVMIEAFENLEKQGVGYIDCEQAGVIHYNIDGRNIRVQVSDRTLSD